MRILHISTRLILGGSQENTVLSCEGQARLGHEVHLAFGPIYGPEGSLLERVEKFRTADARGIMTHVVPHLVREVQPLADWRAFGELSRLIAMIGPDVVHTHSSKAGAVGRIAASGVNASELESLITTLQIEIHTPCGIVHTIHGPPFMPVDGGLVSRGKIYVKNWMYERAEKYAAKRSDVIVSVADAMTREFLARGIGKPEQYVTVRSGMDVDPFLNAAPGETREDMQRSLGLGPDDFIVGTVARLAEHKGHDDLLDALGDSMKRDARLKLLWVGDGWWRERLIRRVHGLGLESQVIATGLVGPERIPGLIRAMDVLAHPSYREGLPRTVPQALLCGVCPVAYDCDGTGEVCREMETGRLVPTGDKEKLRDAILWLKDHPRERAEMAERGREECRVAFSAETMMAELEKVYARAIEMARSG